MSLKIYHGFHHTKKLHDRFSSITVWLSTPFIRPFSFGRLVFTYFIPLAPLFVLWDGVVSCLRTYSVEEMKELVYKLDENDRFNWDIARAKSGPGILLYLLGTPKK